MALLFSGRYDDEGMIASFSRLGAAGYTGNGEAAFQREAAADVLRDSHYISGVACVLLEEVPTPCSLVAPGTPSVTPGALMFSATFSAIAVTTSLLRYEYRLDGAGSWTSNGTSTTLTDIAAAEGSHVLNVRAVSTSGVAGATATSASFDVEGGGGLTGAPAIVSVDSLPSSRNDLDGVGMGVQPQVNITITALGLWKNSGITGTKTVRVYDDDGTTVLASALVALTGAPDDSFVYVPLASPLAVTAFDVVFIFADVTSGVDYVYLDASVTPESDIAVTNSKFRQGGGINNFQGANHNGGPVDLYYTTP